LLEKRVMHTMVRLPLIRWIPEYPFVDQHEAPSIAGPLLYLSTDCRDYSLHGALFNEPGGCFPPTTCHLVDIATIAMSVCRTGTLLHVLSGIVDVACLIGHKHTGSFSVQTGEFAWVPGRNAAVMTRAAGTRDAARVVTFSPATLPDARVGALAAQANHTVEPGFTLTQSPFPDTAQALVPYGVYEVTGATMPRRHTKNQFILFVLRGTGTVHRASLTQRLHETALDPLQPGSVVAVPADTWWELTGELSLLIAVVTNSPDDTAEIGGYSFPDPC
jgi:mannose-6-phosphate isomerase-like protein (cupin superfamily)